MSRKKRDKRRRRYRLWDPRVPEISAALAALGGLFAGIYTFPFTVACGIASAIGFSRALSRRITVDVGDAGVMVRSRRRGTYMAFAEIEGVSVDRRDVHQSVPTELHHVLRLSRRGQQIEVAGPAPRLRQIAEAVESARDRQRPDAHLDTSSIARGERSALEWLQYLKGLGAGALSTYRVAPVNRDNLWSVVEATGEPPALRAAAAIALGRLDRAERKRLARVGRQSACPELRALLAHCLGKRPMRQARQAKLLGTLDRAAQRRTEAATVSSPTKSPRREPWYLQHQGGR